VLKPYRELLNEIKGGHIHKVYLFYGSEQVLMQEVVDALIGQIVPEDSFNFFRFHAEETPIQTVVQEADTMPFMAERRLIVVENAYLFTGTKGQRVEHDLNSLETYLEQPAPYTTVVFLVYADKLDERKKITKLALKQAKVVHFPPLKEAECRDWIEKQVKQRGGRITPEAVNRLLFYVGTHLPFLRMEIDKLCLYVGEAGVIGEEAVDELAARTVEQDVFLFVDELVCGRIERAMRLFQDLLKQKEAPVKLLFMITRQIRIMLQVKLYAERGFAVQHIAGMIGVHPFVCKRAYEQSRNYSRAQLESLLCVLAELDYQIKSGQIGDVQGLEMFLLRFPQFLGWEGVSRTH
jgi:DNA polymerase-3 subunit delta